MSEPLRLDGQVAIVTGASRGLGREYALALAHRGARVLVNSRDAEAARAVVQEIVAGDGEALAFSADVADADQVAGMVDATLQRWGHIDILVNNAGFVRDRSFAKLEPADFRSVLDVHLMGAFNCTHAVWRPMLQARYGRIVMIVSSSGLAGNFGQAAYGAAKMGLVGLATTLGLEGEAHNVRVNCFGPVGVTSMNASVIPAALHEAFAARHVAAGVVWLASPEAPNRAILMGGGGSYERAYVTFTRGCRLRDGTPEELRERFEEVSARAGDLVPVHAADQLEIELANLSIRHAH